jgi:hypothetical protein
MDGGESNNDTENLITPSDEDVELTGCGAKPCCNPTHWVYRFIALMFMSLLGFGKTTGIPLSVFSNPESHRLLDVLSISYCEEVLAILMWHVYFVFLYYPMTSSVSNGYQALYGFDERIINYYYYYFARNKCKEVNQTLCEGQKSRSKTRS